MIDGLIATMLVNEDLPSLPSRTFVIAPVMQVCIIKQSWVTQLQVAETQSCMLEPGAHCFCTSGHNSRDNRITMPQFPTAYACMLPSLCNANAPIGWSCDPAADPLVAMVLTGLLSEHVSTTLVQWAMAAGFVQSSYARQQDETDPDYRLRLVQLLVEPLGRNGYYDTTGDYGVLRPTDPLSAAYAHDHISPASCPANSYGARSEDRTWDCLPCPDGTEAPPGSITVSNCTKISKAEAAAAAVGGGGVAMCASQHADCTDGCLLMPLWDYQTECKNACQERCSKCIRTANSTTAEVKTQCGSTGTDARLPVGQGLVAAALPPSQRQHPRQNGSREDYWLEECLTAGDCVSVEIDAAAPFAKPIVITAMPPDGNRTQVWHFFSPPSD